jgi:5-oxopent-3-ene-1,2,5-tricarboxylate decarboxylase/2-hydroxyhepta-2,4-diene-1,7-dioate isomerase
MFYLDDHVIHGEGEPVTRDVSAEQAHVLMAEPRRGRVSGTVYGTLLNDPATLVAMGDSLNEGPYKAPPTPSSRNRRSPRNRPPLP